MGLDKAVAGVIQAASAPPVGEPGWTAAHQKEFEFQANKERVRQREEYNRKHLHCSEIDAALPEEAADALAGERPLATYHPYLPVATMVRVCMNHISNLWRGGLRAIDLIGLRVDGK
jgi:hypothetical protein